jgi:V/A-type H+-transporting ATPase subunit I
MSLRPTPARWFELLTDREELPRVLECLAATGGVELQRHSQMETAMLLPDLRDVLDELALLANRYGAYWPEPVTPPAVADRDPEALANHALTTVRQWVRAARPVVERLQALDRETSDLEKLSGWLAAPSPLPRLDLLGAAGPMLDSTLIILPRGTKIAELPPGLLTCVTSQPSGTYLLAVGVREEIATLLASQLVARGQVLAIPDWLPADRDGARDKLRDRLAEIQRTQSQLQAKLEQTSQRLQLATALSEFAFIEWLITHVPTLPVTEHFAWVTGWTSAADDDGLADALTRQGLHFLLRFPEAPGDLERPMLLANPEWAKPFEIFTRLLGVPASTEADPSRVVAVVAPLMFGYMFGDVGQGFVLLIAGLILRRRWPPLGLLVSGGVMSMFFGFAFGSVFAVEGLVPALWLHPLEHPLPLLIVTLIFGAALLLFGLGMSAVQMHWQRRAAAWWAADAGMILAYVGVLAAFVYLPAIALTAVGAIWFLLGRSLTGRSAGIGAVGQAFADLSETLLQLVVNTLSFARVGAFALAHAGLSAAVVGIGQASGSRIGFAVALVIGNVFIMVLEGLVVAIQTTRLVLFEFFIRFLEAGGRPFEPLTSFTSAEAKKRRAT